MMSSNEEKEDKNEQRVFVLHILNFRLKNFENLIKTIDDVYMDKSSTRSFEQMRRRKTGEPSNRSLATLKFGSPWKMLMNKLRNFLKLIH